MVDKLAEKYRASDYQKINGNKLLIEDKIDYTEI